MRSTLIAAGLCCAALLGATTAQARPHSFNDGCPAHPQGHAAKGSLALAHKGWDADALKHRPKVIRAVRHRRTCAASRNSQRTVAGHIGKAREQYRKAQEAAKEPEYGSIDPPGADYLYSLRMCESGGDYSTNTGNGFFGAYQFDLGTWQSVGGSGLPSDASPAEQDYRAAVLWRSRGSAPWPVCG